MNAFYVLPGTSLMDLRHELELIEGEGAGDTMERYGYRAGRGLVRSLGLEGLTISDLRDNLGQMWSETGLSRMEIVSLDPAKMRFSFLESIEAEAGRDCRFMGGYLAGTVSELIGKRYLPCEVQCRSNGGDACMIELTPSEIQIPYRGNGQVTVEYEVMEYELDVGSAYLVESDVNDFAYELFSGLVRQGAPGMCLVREYPERAKERYTALEQAHLLWLSYSRDRPYAREPTNIPLIFDEIKDFMNSSNQGVVLISGLEYMITQSNFSKVLKFVQLVSENAAVTDTIVLVPVCTGAIGEKDLRLLERELIIIDPDSG